MKTLLIAGATSLICAGAAQAATILNSTFETPDAPTGSYVIVGSADGWTTLAGPGIEIQDHAAGAPDAAGGDQFVELDSTGNSSMYYQFAQSGTFDLSFLFSPRPGVGSASNIISVYLDNVLLTPPGSLTGNGGNATAWASYGAHFSATAGQRLIFAAEGTSDSLGGYVDNIVITTAGIPEPATWALMIGGFGLAGAALRRRKAIAA